MDPALQRLLDAAYDSHRSGDLEEAQRRYLAVLSQAPRTSDALHSLGLLHHQRGNLAEAERLAFEACQQAPDIVLYHENLAGIQAAQGAHARVIATCRSALARASSPRLLSILFDALLQLGVFDQAVAVLDELDRGAPATADRLADRSYCLLRLGRADEALAAGRRAQAVEPNSANAFSVLAEHDTAVGDDRGAALSWRRALLSSPDWTAARINLGLSLLRANEAAGSARVLGSVPLAIEPALVVAALNGRAAAHRLLKETNLAIRCLQAALTLVPESSEHLSNLSELLRPVAAERARLMAARASAIDPLNAAALNNLGLALEETDRERAAVAAFRSTIALAPAYSEAINNLAGPLRSLGFFAEALAAYRRVLAIKAGLDSALYGLGTTQLALGDLENGWRNFELRLAEGGGVRPRPFPMPRWDGKPLDGRLLVWGEQGLGDEIIFGSMLADLARRDIRAVVECDSRMVSLFARSLPTFEFVGRTNPPDPRLRASDIAAQVAMGSLPLWLRTRPSDFPQTGASLVARGDLVDKWRERLAALGPGPKVGFTWRSIRVDAVGRRDHPPVLDWGPALSRPGPTYISLQYGEAAPDLGRLEAAFGVKVHCFEDLDLMNDLEGILALSTALDLVLASPSTGFCLPAASGVPVWLFVPENTFLRLGTNRFPWFPNVRTYVHPLAQPRAATMENIGRDLSRWLIAHTAGHG